MTKFVVVLVVMSICTILQAKDDSYCFEKLISPFKSCLEDEEIKSKVYDIVSSSLWLEEKAKEFINYCDQNGLNSHYFLLKAIWKSFPLYKLHFDKNERERYKYYDEVKYDFDLYALSAFYDVGIISSDELEEYVRCSWKPKERNNLHSSAQTIQQIIRACLIKKLVYGVSLFPAERTAFIDQECTPNWYKISEQIKVLIRGIRQEELHFEKVTNFVSENSSDIDELVNFYDEKWIPKEIKFADDRLREIKNLIKTELFLSEKVSEFGPKENRDKIEKLAKRRSLLPSYVNAFKKLRGKYVILINILQKESRLLADEELLPLLKNAINISKLMSFMAKYYGKEVWENERKNVAASKEIKKYFESHRIGGLATYYWWNVSSDNIWDQKINFKDFVDESCKDITLLQNMDSLVDLYKNLFGIMHADILPIPDDDQKNILADTLLIVEEESSKLLAMTKDERTLLIQNAYDVIKQDLSTKSVCPIHSYGKIWVLSILIELLEGIDQKELLKNNLLTTLRIENLFKLRFPKNAEKHFNNKNQLLPDTYKMIEIIDSFDFK